MGAFWAFLALALLPTIWPASMAAVQFISSGVLQLVALPLLAVSGILLGRAAETRAQADHEAIMAEMVILKEMQAELHSVLTAVRPAAYNV
ncbi:MAG TPA: hypothetical protein VMH92_03990 [Acidocella sp.]|nr:hypothetical protein [Acidocella sp.]